jgi:tRNA(fMet)-specific endonuclease VapC
MIYALDSNTISFLLRPSYNPEVVREFEKIIKQGDDYVIPPLCYYEVRWHLLRKNATAQIKVFEDLYANSLTRINMGENEFIKASEIKASLVTAGTPIGSRDGDIFIAAHCLVNGYTLVTDNVSDFQRIGGLNIINWKI